MKLLLFLFVLISCGKYESSSNPRLGQIVKFEPLEMTDNQKTLQSTICQAVEAKTSRLALENGKTYSFAIQETACDGQTTQEQTVEVKVEVLENSIQFVRENGSYFIFRDAETLRSGIFKSYCSSSKIPFLHNGNPVWVNNRAQDACERGSQTDCINFTFGLKEQNSENTYRVSSEDIFTINTSNTSSQYGYYTHRVMRSNLNCDSGTHIIKARLN